MHSIYLDYAASTPLDERVLKLMQDHWRGMPGNAGALHRFGVTQGEALDQARQDLTEMLGGVPEGLVFTSSATEANNLALKGVVAAALGKHIIISAVEHASVYQTAKYLQTYGTEVSILPVDASGVVQVNELSPLIRKDTALVSVLMVNNETGMIQPIAEIAQLCRDRGVLFHTDAAQGFARFPIDLSQLPVDLLTASGHKIYGPVGSAFLYARPGIALEPQLQGGGQEQGRRASTVNVAAAVAMAGAAKLYAVQASHEHQRLAKLRSDFLQQLRTKISGVELNGTLAGSSPHILNVSFTGCDAEVLAMQLDRKGIAVSTGSACASGTVKQSRVLQAMSSDKKRLKGAIRFSFGRQSTAEELATVAEELSPLVRKVRKIS